MCVGIGTGGVVGEGGEEGEDSAVGWWWRGWELERGHGLG